VALLLVTGSILLAAGSADAADQTTTSPNTIGGAGIGFQSAP
jgi:hypothetical protein